MGDRYIHPFGRYGQATWMAEFHNFWLHARAMGSTVPIDEYCHESLAALKGRFARRENPRINYAYHFDAALYARFLRKISEARGTKRVEGKIKTVRTNEHTGFVESLELNDGRLIDGDLFIDCTGFRGLLIEGALHTGFEDWAHWLPCDSAVAAFGLASGFVEPLESTSIHMIMTAAVRLAHFFPFNGVQQSMVEQYNDLARNEIEQIRDFVCMHYHCTQRDDSDFWRYCRNMEIPASLQRRIDLFREGGYLYQGKDELIRVDSWIAVFLGQNIEPSTYHHFARTNDKELAEYLARHRSQIAEVVNALPAHADFVRQYAGASPDAWDLALQGSPVANSYRGASLR